MTTKYPYTLQRSNNRLVNTDPQRRCYNGCHAKSEIPQGPWMNFEPFLKTREEAEEKKKWWE